MVCYTQISSWTTLTRLLHHRKLIPFLVLVCGVDNMFVL
jgi:hypothetical protein